MKSRIALASLSVLLLIACQVAFGDFTIDTTQLAVSCEAGSSRCLGNQIQTCAGGNEWRVVQTCLSPDLCNLLSLSCAACEPGTYQCSGSLPQICDENQHWSAATAACASASLCVVPKDGSPALCLDAACPAGQMQCFGGHLQRCPLSQKSWEDVEICASTALCDVNQANAEVAAGKPATCLLPTCSPGQFNCETGSPQPCNADHTGWDAATTSCTGATCNPDQGDCSACVPGTSACSGSNLESCTDQATWASTPCKSALACNAGANPGCDPAGTCTAGAFRCNSSTSALERCRSDGTRWELVEQCANVVLCNPNATSCEAPICPTSGVKRCQGNTRQKCRDDLTGWDEVTQCSNTGSCDPELGCLPTPCVAGDFRCNDVSLEACKQGTWVRQAVCATRALCDATQRACTLPTCDAGARQCLGSVLSRCNADRDGWVELETCRSGSMCNPDTKRCE
jgi:hypothetical protein